MEPADPVIPHRPFMSLIEKVRAALKTSSRQDVLQDNPMLLDLSILAEQTVPINSPLDINGLLIHIDALSKDTPAPSALRKAPLLDPWCAVIDLGCPVLIGVAVGQGWAQTS